MAIMAFLTNKNGGELIISKEEIINIPEAAFTVDYTNDVFTFKLTPEEKSTIDTTL